MSVFCTTVLSQDFLIYKLATTLLVADWVNWVNPRPFIGHILAIDYYDNSLQYVQKLTMMNRLC